MRSFRVLKYIFSVGKFKSYDAVLVHSGFITDLLPHCSPTSVVSFEPGNREIFLQPRYLWHLVRLMHRHSRQAASLGAYVRSVEAKAVIAYDNIPVLYDWASALPMPLIVVQHGMRQLEPMKQNIAQTSNVVFLSWGKLQVDEFASGLTARYPNSSHQRKPERVIPIGSLRDSMYRQVRKEVDRNLNQLCLVSQFKGLDGHGLTLPRERQVNLDTTAEFTHRYAIERNIQVLIALYSDTPQALQAEKNWFNEKFEGTCIFNNPSEDFATYKATDESIVSLGVHTSVLWEVFGRSGRILACNFTGDTVFKFPIPGPWYLENGSYDEFATRLDLLRAFSDAEYLNTCGDLPTYLISYDPTKPTTQAISDTVSSFVNGTH